MLPASRPIPNEHKYKHPPLRDSLCSSQASSPKVLLSDVLKEAKKFSKDAGLMGFETVKRCLLDTSPFGVENDLLTPTMKLRRPQLIHKYKDRLLQLYEQVVEEEPQVKEEEEPPPGQSVTTEPVSPSPEPDAPSLKEENVEEAAKQEFAVGDAVKSSWGTGTVSEVRDDGTVVYTLDNWELAYGSKVKCFLNPASMTKNVKSSLSGLDVGDAVKSAWGTGTVSEVREDGTVLYTLDNWELAYGSKVKCFLNPRSVAKV